MNTYSASDPLPALIHIPQKRRCKSAPPEEFSEPFAQRFHGEQRRMSRTGHFTPTWRVLPIVVGPASLWGRTFSGA